MSQDVRGLPRFFQKETVWLHYLNKTPLILLCVHELLCMQFLHGKGLFKLHEYSMTANS